MRGYCVLSLIFIIPLAGCAGIPCQCQANGEKGPRTLLEWQIPKKEEKKDEKNGDEKKGDNKTESNRKGTEEIGDNKTERPGGKAVENGTGSASGSEDKSADEEQSRERIDPDRPHLPEAASTVGLGHVVLESGFTYNTSGGYFNRYSFPEALLRIGACYDWLEFRIAGNMSGEYLGPKATALGADDLQLGVKLAMTEQNRWMPESCLILQMWVPTGSPGFSANRVLPGIHYDCGWEVIKDKLSVETVIFADGSVDNNGHTYTLLGHGVTAAYDLTKKLEAFGEIDSFYSVGESAGPQHYLVGGLVYFITKKFEIDIRAGVGLNEHANGYLLGSGFAYRW